MVISHVTETRAVTDDAWVDLTVSGYVKSQNKRYWSAGNPMLVYDMPFLDIKVGVWCATSATSVTVSIFSVIVNLGIFIARQFWTPQTVLCVGRKCLYERIIRWELWPPCLPDLNPFEFYLWGMLNNELCSNSLRSEDGLRKIIHVVAELRFPIISVFARCDACLQVEEIYFQQFLVNMVRINLVLTAIHWPETFQHLKIFAVLGCCAP